VEILDHLGMLGKLWDDPMAAQDVKLLIGAWQDNAQRERLESWHSVAAHSLRDIPVGYHRLRAT